MPARGSEKCRQCSKLSLEQALLYRPRVGDPLHAVGAELWVGQKKVAAVEPVHTLGMSGSQVKTYLKQILQSFSQEQGVELEKFAAQVELDPQACPIHPCPLRP